MILNIVNYPLDSERETVSEQFQGSWRLGTAQALHAQYKSVSSVNIRHLGTPYERVPRFLIHGWNSARFRRCPVFFVTTMHTLEMVDQEALYYMMQDVLLV